jgi:hypothetical protein
MRKLVLDNAEWFAMYQLDKYFDLNSKQEKWLKPIAGKHVRWLRTSKLPEVVQAMEDMKTAWSNGPNAADIREFQQRYDAFRVSVVTQLADDAGEFLAVLSEAQLLHLEKRLAQSNEEQEEALTLSPTDFAKQQRRRVLKNINFWIDGKLSPPQEDSFFAALPPNQTALAEHIQARKTSQKNFLELLRTKKSPREIAFQLNIWAKSPHLMRGTEPPANRPSRMQQMILTAHQVFNEEQRKQVIQQITLLQRDLLP